MERLEERRMLSIASLSISSPTIAQPASGTANLNFTVTRSGETLSTVTVGYATSNGTATAGSDYLARTGSVTIPAGSSTATISIPVLHDGTNTGNQNFHVNLTGITNVVGPSATLAAKQDLVATQPYAVAVADMNGDGKPDLVTGNLTAGIAISLFRNTTAPGATTASFATKQDVTTIAYGVGTCVAVGDLNGDGKPDVVVSDGLSSLKVLFNATPAGATTFSFGPEVDLPITPPLHPDFVTLGDFNGDGRLDLVTGPAVFGSQMSVFLNTTSPGATSGSFSAEQTFPINFDPEFAAVGDINHDGKADIITATRNADAMSVFLNTTATGGTTTSFSTQHDFASGTNPYSVTVGDVNGDGKLDVAVANRDSNSVSVFLNTTVDGSATPTFSAKNDFAVGTSPRAVAFRDLNGDGKPDLTVANHDSNTLSVLINTTAPGASAATFATKRDFATDADPSFVAVADLNGDGKPDVAVPSNTGNAVSVFLNTTVLPPPAVSTAPKQAFATGDNPYNVAIGDLNGDGKPDLVIANRDANTLSALINATATGAQVSSFAVKQDFPTGSGARFLALEDLNGDGKLDIAVANFLSNTVSVLLNTSSVGSNTVQLTAKQDLTTGLLPVAVAFADLNGDGKPDLIVSNESSYSQSIFLNTTTLGSNVASFAPRQDIPSGGSSGSVKVADFNCDGLLDLAVVNRLSDGLSILLNTTPVGSLIVSFVAAQTFSTGGTLLDASFLTAGDINGDGRADLVVSNFFSNNVSTLTNTTTPGSSTASFNPMQTFSVATSTGAPFAVALHDLDGDGKLDIVVASLNGSDTANASVLLNSTSPGAISFSFQASQSFDSGTDAVSAAIGDLNGDGRADLVVANRDVDSASVLLNPAALISLAQGTGTITFSASNHAPVLDNNKSPTVTAMHVNDGAPVGPVGTLVSKLVDFKLPVGQVDNVTDVDNGARLGIAVTTTDTSRGTWFYSVNDGHNWLPLGTPSNTAARLLNADPVTRVYFRPNSAQPSLLPTAITFRAWDRTTGTNGSIASTATSGSATAFSSLVDTASLNVLPANRAPVLDALKKPALHIVGFGAPPPRGYVGTLVSKLVEFASAGPLGNVTDADSGAQLGIAITSAATTNGTWYYSTNNGATWLALGSASMNSARLLAADAATRLYFRPNTGFKGGISAALTFRTWDRTTGVNGGTADVTTAGGTSAFSSAVDTASIVVIKPSFL